MTFQFEQLDSKIQRIFLFFVFTSFILILCSVKFYFHSFDPVYLIEKHSQVVPFNHDLNNVSLPNCSIFLPGVNSYTVSINGSQYPKSVSLLENKSINFECLQNTETLKTILLWTPFFGSKNFGLELGKEKAFINGKCPVTKCELTNDKAMINKADLVIVHMRDGIRSIPLERNQNQRWVFTLFESPVHSPNLKKFNGIFNLTATYRIDSDFPFFYATSSKMRWNRNEKFNFKKDFLAGKTDFAAAVISNCGGTSKRLELIRELQQFVSVNVFGKCGKPCPNQFKNSTLGDCKTILATEYKFYFAFENSVCRDYITEKFFVILKYDIIPVVFGGGPYDHYIPKSGFIDASDFDSPKHLADYLIYLDKNSSAYNSYFEWKQHVTFDFNPSRFSMFCDMCIKLHMDRYTGIEKKVFDDIHGYWHSSMCKTVKLDSQKLKLI